MDLSFEEDIPVLFSPLTDHENDSTDQDEEHFEPNLLKYTNNLSSQPQEYVEPDFPESKYNNYLTSAVNGIQLSSKNYQNSDSDTSWDELRRLESTLDNISSDSEDSILKMEEGEISPTSPRRVLKKKPQKPKIPNRLKKQLT